jgi:predicted ATP-grasp superfamily ATP-dependent carboligase
MLKRAVETGIPVIALLTQAFYNHPDPEAAAQTVLSLNGILGTKVEVSDLLKRGDEIRLKAKDIMRRVTSEMSKMDKSQEYDVPPLYM